MKNILHKIVNLANSRRFDGVLCIVFAIEAVVCFILGTWVFIMLGVSLAMLSISYLARWKPFGFGEKS